MWPHQIDKLPGLDPELLSFLHRLNLSHLTQILQKEEVLTMEDLLPLDNEEGINKILGMYDPPCNLMQIMANSNSDRDAHKDNFKISFHFR